MYITAKVQQELPPKSLFKRQNHHPQRSGLHQGGRHRNDCDHPHRLQRHPGYSGRGEVSGNEQIYDTVYPGIYPRHAVGTDAAAGGGRSHLPGAGGYLLPGRGFDRSGHRWTDCAQKTG